MTYLKAILLGLVQGIAEFLPISSSGHLAIARNLLNMEGAGSIPEFFDVLLHLGTLIAVFAAYWSDIRDMVVEFFRGIGDLAHRSTPTPVPPARRLILTASGGPFLHTPKERLCEVTVEQALRHPNWSMGAKITVDSSTMVNKGFEVIEAHWLFGLPAEKIDVLVHPQSVVHSMVEFADGAIKAQLGTPDMRLPIQYALTFPERPDYGGQRFDFARSLTFEEVDGDKFPALGIAYECLERGGTAPCTMNAANEVAVAAFLQGRIGYSDIVRLIERALERADFLPSPTVEDYTACDREVRGMVSAML